jgi:hypothetical protein
LRQVNLLAPLRINLKYRKGGSKETVSKPVHGAGFQPLSWCCFIPGAEPQEIIATGNKGLKARSIISIETVPKLPHFKAGSHHRVDLACQKMAQFEKTAETVAQFES